MDTKPFNIAIVGGGISGVTLAICLLQHNVPVTIYESAARFGEIGAGLGMGPNSVRAMGLISPDIVAGFERCVTLNGDGNRSNWFTVRVGDQRKAGPDGVLRQKESAGLRVGDAIFEINYTNDGQAGGVHRAHFLDELLKLVPKSVQRLGKRLVDITSADGSQDAVLHFADGTTAQHSAVIGCDGIKSRTRQILLGEDEAKPVFTGKYAYRGLIPMEKATEILGNEIAANSQIYLGYHGHLLTYPIQKGKTMNVVAFSSCESWTDPQWVVPTSREKMLADYEGWGATVGAVVGAMEKRDVWALFEHAPARTYYGTGPRICLLGDAAHATTPHQGAGAGMCIEDCAVLGRLIAAAAAAPDLDRAFRAYDRVRRPRTQRLVRTSREAGALYQFELEADDLDAIQRNLARRMAWIWDADLRQDLKTALAMMLRDERG
ncbi:mannitol 1-phosphate dehydrogenase [Durotheca rogersii]|uniref:mannitol 1-phosphate dehydrogenase n=1 Tax=Durotheca rogersii TaxID=419775 RepID=UPI00221E7662|nr:mannitol 1-phosphate dehydrogenase [Durotheca rogersii]KAI5861324.1 mannitol 1-phosphate dehydrogenase [Durotheca rogersii]